MCNSVCALTAGVDHLCAGITLFISLIVIIVQFLVTVVDLKILLMGRIWVAVARLWRHQSSPASADQWGLSVRPCHQLFRAFEVLGGKMRGVQFNWWRICSWMQSTWMANVLESTALRSRNASPGPLRVPSGPARMMWKKKKNRSSVLASCWVLVWALRKVLCLKIWSSQCHLQQLLVPGCCQDSCVFWPSLSLSLLGYIHCQWETYRFVRSLSQHLFSFSSSVLSHVMKLVVRVAHNGRQQTVYLSKPRCA